MMGHRNEMEGETMTTHTFKFDHIITREGRLGERDYELEITYGVTDYVAATMYQPAEGGEVEILSIKDAFWQTEFEVSGDEEDAILDAAESRADSDLSEWYAEYEEYKADQARDRRMEA